MPANSRGGARNFRELLLKICRRSVLDKAKERSVFIDERTDQQSAVFKRRWLKPRLAPASLR